MTTSKGLGISIKHGDHSRTMELRVNQHALGVRVPQGDNLRPALLRKLPSHFRLPDKPLVIPVPIKDGGVLNRRSEEHTSELQSRSDLVCRLLLEKKKTTTPARGSRTMGAPT